MALNQSDAKPEVSQPSCNVSGQTLQELQVKVLELMEENRKLRKENMELRIRHELRGKLLF